MPTKKTTKPASRRTKPASHRTESASRRAESASRRTKPAPRRRPARSSAASDPTRLLATFPNPAPERDYVIRHVAPEFTSRCPVTGQPDFGTVIIEYVADGLCVELKSLKLYLQAFREEGIFYEALTNRLLDDLVRTLQPRQMVIETRWRPRGGMRSAIVAEYSSGTLDAGAVPE